MRIKWENSLTVYGKVFSHQKGSYTAYVLYIQSINKIDNTFYGPYLIKSISHNMVNKLLGSDFTFPNSGVQQNHLSSGSGKNW